MPSSLLTEQYFASSGMYFRTSAGDSAKILHRFLTSSPLTPSTSEGTSAGEATTEVAPAPEATTDEKATEQAVESEKAAAQSTTDEAATSNNAATQDTNSTSASN